MDKVGYVALIDKANKVAEIAYPYKYHCTHVINTYMCGYKWESILLMFYCPKCGNTACAYERPKKKMIF